MNRIKILLLICIVNVATFGHAQQKVSDGTAAAAINPNAILDLQSASKGLLLPRVALTSTTVAAPVGTTFTAGMAGMTVYNINTAGDVTPGYYYSDGSKWVRMADAANIPSAWLPGGNTNGALKSIGTNDAYDLPVTVKGTEAMRAIWDATNSVTRVAVGATTAATVASGTSGSTAALRLAKLTTDNGDASINGMSVGKGGGQIEKNTAVGNQSLYNNTTGTTNVGIGYKSLTANTTGIANIGIGSQALITNSTGANNVAIGDNALYFNNGSDNVAVGYRAADNITSGVSNIGIGSSALHTNKTGGNNVAIGENALLNNTVSYNTAIGFEAGKANTTGAYNVGVGGLSLTANTTGEANTGVGFHALYTNSTGSNNVAIGQNALYYNTAGNNTALGYQAGDHISTGTNNTTLGYQAGNGITTGANNIVIGALADAASVTGSNQLNIGNAIFGTGMTGTAAAPAGNIGIGTTAPTQKLHINGKLRIEDTSKLTGATAQQLFVDGNGLVGTFDAEGPKTVFYDAGTAETSVANNVTAFNNLSKITLTIADADLKINTLGSTRNQRSIVIPEAGYYQLYASLSTQIGTGTAGDNVFQVFNIEKSSDSGSTWSVVSGLRGLHIMYSTATTVRYYINLPTVVVYLTAGTYLRLTTYRPLSSGGTGLGVAVTYFEIAGVTDQGTRGYTFGITKL